MSATLLFDRQSHTYDLTHPLRVEHPLAQGLVWCGVALPGLMGGQYWHNLVDYGVEPPLGRHGLLTNMSVPFHPSQNSGWAPIYPQFAPSTASAPIPNLGGELRFNGGTSYVEVADTPSLQLVNIFTIAFWIRPQVADGMIISKMGGTTCTGTDVRGIRFQASSMFVTDSGSGGGSNPLSVSWVDYFNSWAHVILTSSSSGSTLYRNGISVATGVQLTAWFNNTRVLRIGASECTNIFITAAGTSFQGALGSMMLYNMAFSSESAQSLYRESLSYASLLQRLLNGEGSVGGGIPRPLFDAGVLL